MCVLSLSWTLKVLLVLFPVQFYAHGQDCYLAIAVYLNYQIFNWQVKWLYFMFVNSSEKPIELDLEKTVDVDDEVFFGPIGYTERCVATKTSTVEEEEKGMSPISALQWAHIAKEAYMMSHLLKKEASVSKGTSESSSSQAVEDSSSSNKKKHTRKGTFTLDNSPFELLPVDVQNILPVIDIDIDTPKLPQDTTENKKRKSEEEKDIKCIVKDSNKENEPKPVVDKRRSRLAMPKRLSTLPKPQPVLTKKVQILQLIHRYTIMILVLCTRQHACSHAEATVTN